MQVVIAHLPPAGAPVLRSRDPLHSFPDLVIVGRVQTEGPEAAHELPAEVHVARSVFRADVIDVVP